MATRINRISYSRFIFARSFAAALYASAWLTVALLSFADASNFSPAETPSRAKRPALTSLRHEINLLIKSSSLYQTYRE